MALNNYAGMWSHCGICDKPYKLIKNNMECIPQFTSSTAELLTYDGAGRITVHHYGFCQECSEKIHAYIQSLTVAHHKADLDYNAEHGDD